MNHIIISKKCKKIHIFKINYFNNKWNHIIKKSLIYSNKLLIIKANYPIHL
jgi:hypothetical protein